MHTGPGRGRLLLAAAATTITTLLVSCGGGDDGSSPTTAGRDTDVTASPTGSAPPSARCLVLLHGKGSEGGPTVVDDGVSVRAPTGNADGWGARQWLYFPDDEYESARAIVGAATDGCERIIIGGFSNGASFAAALYCSGETFDGRLVRVVIDDPVVDHGVDACTPDPAVDVALYWTGALDETSAPGWDCGEADWTCQGGSTIGVEAYAEALATDVLPSPLTDHEWHLDAPELTDWA